jgi:hypothetical protein
MKLLKLSAYFILMAITAMTFVSCEDDAEEPLERFAPAAVTNMKATSKDISSINVAFILSSDENAEGFAGYRLTVTDEDDNNLPFGDSLDYMSIPAGNNFVTIGNLDEGEIYTISITCSNVYSRDEANNIAAETLTSDATTIDWSPASRQNEDIDGEVIKMFGVSSQFGSGIAIDGGDVYNVSVGANESWLMAFCNKDDALTFGSAAASCYSLDNVGTCQLELLGYGENLDEFLRSENLDTENYKEDVWSLTDDLTEEGNPIFAFKVVLDFTTIHYGKIMLVKNGDSYVYEAGTDDEYIVAIISYQNKANVPYAEAEKKSSPSSN